MSLQIFHKILIREISDPFINMESPTIWVRGWEFFLFFLLCFEVNEDAKATNMLKNMCEQSTFIKFLNYIFR